jgi:hypothetical protein
MNLFFARSENKQLRFSNPRVLDNYLASVDKKALYVTVELVRGIRTLNQNAYLWGVVYKLIADDTGHSENEIHLFCKKKFMKRKFLKVLGEEIEEERTTTRMSKIEFSEYVEAIRAHFAEFGIIKVLTTCIDMLVVETSQLCT